jgi:hypothetical protein
LRLASEALILLLFAGLFQHNSLSPINWRSFLQTVQMQLTWHACLYCRLYPGCCSPVF